MPVLGFGTIPAAGAGGNELVATTRRAVMPAVVVQLGQSTVTVSSMLAAAEPVTGGVSPVTIPIQGTRMVTFGPSNYTGEFATPQLLQGLQNAEYNLMAGVGAIPRYLFESYVQQDAELVEILWARLNDMGNVISDYYATRLFAAQSANTALEIFSLYDIISTTNPAQGNVGNIDRTTSAFWQATVRAITAINSASAAWSRVNVLAAIMSAQSRSGGESASCGIVSPGAWMALATDYIGSERYEVTHEGTYGDAAEGASAAFPAINVGGIPIYADLYQTTNSDLFLPNWDYLQFKIHAQAAFAIEGPESLLPQGQLGHVMAIVVLLSAVCSKPVAQARITSFTGAMTP